MKKYTANIPDDFQKDGIKRLRLEYDVDTDGWYLYGHVEDDQPAAFDLWQMTEDYAKTQAKDDWGVDLGAWQSAGAEDEDTTPTRDCNGTILQDGDTITVIKDLDVKGAGTTVKRGTTVKNISLTNDPELIDCRTKDIKGLVLKTCFVKKI